MTTGFTFSVLPALPGGPDPDPSTGIISGTPQAGVPATYTITANNSARRRRGDPFPVSLGVQADLAGEPGLRRDRGGLHRGERVVTLNPPMVTGGCPPASGSARPCPPG